MWRFYSALVAILLLVSCSKELDGDCLITLSFSNEYSALIEELRTKGDGAVIPDTNDFILSIKNESGNEIYYGAYGQRPGEIEVLEGTYIIKIVSEEFAAPAFSSPQYGDSCSVEIASGAAANVVFLCKQMNVGMKINYSSDFKAKFSSSKIFLSGTGGTLEYPYSENRVAYFLPGKVVMRMETSGVERYILSRELNKSEVLAINMTVGAEEMGEAHFRLVVDTSTVWITENYEYGKENDGSTRKKAYTVPEAIERCGEADVWVCGVIVGGDATSASFSFSGPFKSDTHLIIAASAAETDRNKCMAVELKSGAVRDSLNLVSHPNLFHKGIFLKGTIVQQYFGLGGIKGVKEFYKE